MKALITNCNFLKKNLNWIIYCILYEHEEITVGQISQCKFGFVNNITFKDYFAIISLRVFMKLIINQGTFDEIIAFKHRLKFLTQNESRFLSFFIKKLKNNEVCYFTYSHLSLIRKKNYSFNKVKSYISIYKEIV